MRFKQEARKPGTLLDDLSGRIIGAAIRVHKELGPGFLESVYEEAFAVELAEAGITYERQKPLSILYREHHVGEHRLDFLVENAVVVELKAIAALENIHFVVMRSYLRAANLECGLIFNFAQPTLAIKRIGKDFTGARKHLDLHV